MISRAIERTTGSPRRTDDGAHVTRLFRLRPDPIGWASIYLAAAAVSFAALRAPGGWIPAAALCAIASIWAVTLAPAATRTSLPALFETWEMMDANVEEGRELGGLLLIAIWSAVLAARARRIANRAASRPA